MASNACCSVFYSHLKSNHVNIFFRYNDYAQERVMWKNIIKMSEIYHYPVNTSSSATTHLWIPLVEPLCIISQLRKRKSTTVYNDHYYNAQFKSDKFLFNNTYCIFFFFYFNITYCYYPQYQIRMKWNNYKNKSINRNVIVTQFTMNKIPYTFTVNKVPFIQHERNNDQNEKTHAWVSI